MNALRNLVYASRASLTPITFTSTYQETGHLTPTEFVRTGDALISQCPSWSWVADGRMNYLPQNKQFLRTFSVFCQKRVSDHLILPDISEVDEYGLVEAQAKPVVVEDDIPIIPDNIDEDMKLEEEDDPYSCIYREDVPRVDPNLRIYNFDITYDHVYRCPRLWITGRDAYNNWLRVEDIMQDISADHGRKTVTIEDHPFLNYRCLSIHPCQHANMIRALGPDKGDLDPKNALKHFMNMAITIMPTADFIAHL